jgi:hypothetical protein
MFIHAAAFFASAAAAPSAPELELCYLLVELELCSIPKAPMPPRIQIITQDFEAAPVDRKKRDKNAKPIRKNSKIATKTATNRLSVVRDSDSKLNGKSGTSSR